MIDARGFAHSRLFATALKTLAGNLVTVRELRRGNAHGCGTSKYLSFPSGAARSPGRVATGCGGVCPSRGRERTFRFAGHRPGNLGWLCGTFPRRGGSRQNASGLPGRNR